MKKIFTLFIFLFATKIFACVCAPTSLLDLAAKADFIATVEVIDISKDLENEDAHIIQIKILELFKGSKISSLKLLSRLNSSCSFYTPKNTKWLIFAYKGKDGKLSFGYCSGTKTLSEKFTSEIYSRKYSKEKLDELNANYQDKINKKIQVLGYLKTQKIKPINEFDLRIYFTDDCLKQVRGFEEESERFSLYELTINKDLSIAKVLALKEFNNEKLKLNLSKCFENGVTVYKNADETSISNKTKIVIGLYYYPAKGKRESFIAKRAL